MTDPKRLLETASGRARELLDVGLSDASPASVRAKVLSSVSAVVAGLDLGALQGQGTSLSHEPSAAEGLGGNTVTAPTALSTVPHSSALTKLVSVAKSAAAIKLSAVLATLGLGALVYHQVQQRETAPAVAQAVARSYALAPVEPPVLVPVERPAPPIVESAPEVAPASPPPDAAPAMTTDPRVAARASAVPQRKTPSRSSPLAARGVLSAELSLLGRARQRIEAGDLERAGELLDEYARRFPHGALHPEADALRERSRASARH